MRDHTSTGAGPVPRVAQVLARRCVGTGIGSASPALRGGAGGSFELRCLSQAGILQVEGMGKGGSSSVSFGALLQRVGANPQWKPAGGSRSRARPGGAGAGVAAAGRSTHLWGVALLELVQLVQLVLKQAAGQQLRGALRRQELLVCGSGCSGGWRRRQGACGREAGAAQTSHECE